MCVLPLDIVQTGCRNLVWVSVRVSVWVWNMDVFAPSIFSKSKYERINNMDYTGRSPTSKVRAIRQLSTCKHLHHTSYIYQYQNVAELT